MEGEKEREGREKESERYHAGATPYILFSHPFFLVNILPGIFPQII